MGCFSSPELVLQELFPDTDEADTDDLQVPDARDIVNTKADNSQVPDIHDTMQPEVDNLQKPGAVASTSGDHQPSPEAPSDSTTNTMVEESSQHLEAVASIAPTNCAIFQCPTNITTQEVLSHIDTVSVPPAQHVLPPRYQEKQHTQENPQSFQYPNISPVQTPGVQLGPSTAVPTPQSYGDSPGNSTTGVPPLPRGVGMPQAYIQQAQLPNISQAPHTATHNANMATQYVPALSNGLPLQQPSTSSAPPVITVQNAGISADGRQQFVATVNGVPVVVYNTPQGWSVAPVIPPIGPQEEHLLVDTLRSSRREGRSDKDAIERLHGVNQHTTAQWTEYYLEHSTRINKLVDSYIGRQSRSPESASTATRRRTTEDKGKEVKWGRVGVKREKDHSPSIRVGSSHKRHPQACTTRPSNYDSLPSRSRHKRSSLHPRRSRSRSADRSDGGSAPPSDDRPRGRAGPGRRAPPMPARSPTPPMVVIQRGAGNAFTPEDEAYFRVFLAWELARDPSLSKRELTMRLEQKCPHHTHRSWGEYWRRHASEVEPIVLAALERRNVATPGPQQRDESDSGGETASAYDPYSDRDVASEDEKLLVRRAPGRKPRRTTSPVRDSLVEDDVHRIAERIVADPDWERLDARRKWQSFEELWPHRGWEGWYSFNRRNDEAIQRLARKYKREEQRIALIEERISHKHYDSSSSKRMPDSGREGERKRARLHD
ncbi:hypothetical protein OBBRIDRAFT_891259 [Obba rivulosa]|uniref:Uncharacterized protein n=1 Tax=Obba rivulosa TaxID=1052685 RepID=A0A8E2DK02_9APHY|nr:hypothetical protein OBBRIDRAFT_891259 [Obba rivulosa]